MQSSRVIKKMSRERSQSKKRDWPFERKREKSDTGRENVESILGKSREHLMNKEIPEEMIKTKIVEVGNVTKTINREANQGQYAAVAVGRTGAGQGLLKSIFMGSVTDTLFRVIEKASLWICH